MIERKRLFLLAVIGITVLVCALGCNRQQVTGANAMPENSSLSPGEQRKAMIQWHHDHDKVTGDGSTAAPSKN